jgi:hypothetical protein
MAIGLTLPSLPGALLLLLLLLYGYLRVGRGRSVGVWGLRGGFS